MLEKGFSSNYNILSLLLFFSISLICLSNESVAFIENKGQIIKTNGELASEVLFKASNKDLDIFITTSGITYNFFSLKEKEENREKKNSPIPEFEEMECSWEKIELKLEGASIKKENSIAEKPNQHFYQYFLPHCPKGITDVKSFEKITIKEIYKGIDWVIYFNNGAMKYDFIVRVNANLNDIKLLYSTLQPIKIDDGGRIIINTERGTLIEDAPVCYQSEKLISSFFKINGVKNTKDVLETSLSFDIKEYSPKYDLIIDPQLTWATFLGGNGVDGPMAIVTDDSGNLYQTGYTSSLGFPIQAFAGSYNQSVLGGGNDGDVFISKYAPSGALIWSTFFGGSSNDNASAIYIDNNTGNILIAGFTQSANFPLQAFAGGYNQSSFGGGFNDAFVLKFTNSGALLWSSYVGGSGDDYANDIILDANGYTIMTGSTGSTNFPTQALAGAYNEPNNHGGTDAFFIAFDINNSMSWSTYFGGSSNDGGYSIDTKVNDVFFLGWALSSNVTIQNLAGAYNQAPSSGGLIDLFIVRFDINRALIWSTCFGGTGSEGYANISFDGQGNMVVAGSTLSTNFPIQNLNGAFNQTVYGGGQRDLFVSRFNSASLSLEWSTYYGGSSEEILQSMVTDQCGNIFLGFETQGPTLTSISNSGFDNNQYNGGTSDCGIVLFSNNGVRVWDTYLGGDGADFRNALAIDKNRNLYSSGEWARAINPNSYPLKDQQGGSFYDGTPNGSDDGFICKFSLDTFFLQQANSCSNCTGTASVFTTECSSAYTYLWSNGSQTINSPNTYNMVSGLCPGVYTATVVTDAGSSILNYTILPGATTTNTISATSCNSYSSPSGNIYNSSGIYQDTLLNSLGCDSVITINLTINNTASTSITAVACVSYTSPSGNIYYSTDTYEDTLTSSSGCDSLITINLTINYPVSNSGVVSLCQGENLLVHGNLVNLAGVYTQTYSAANGCDSVSTITVQVDPLPSVSIFPSASVVSAGSTVTVSAITAASNFLWSTGETTSSISITPAQTTVYCVTVATNDSCNATICDSVIVEAEYSISIPNVFSPNLDGINDLFIVETKNIAQYLIKIYNRWGIQVFESSDPEKHWDGHIASSGTQAPEGTYYYVVEVELKDKDKKVELFKSFLTLLK